MTNSLCWLAQAAPLPPDYWPFAVLLLSVGLIVILISVLRVHAFLALILAAIAAGLLARELPGEPARSHWIQAVELTTAEFGLTAGKIGVVIALASVIGMCLLESGAADKVVRRFLALFGMRRAGAALLISGYILSIPIFFDTFFMLMLPLAVALHLRTGKDYLLYVMAICCGGTVTHSLVAPHPGPLAMAESLKLDLGLTIMVGIGVGVIPMTCSWLAMQWANRRMIVPLRNVPGLPLAELRATAEKAESELPPFGLSILPVILPIALISLASTFTAIQGKGLAGSDFSDRTAFVERLRAGADPVSRFLAAQLSPSTRQALAQSSVGQPPSAVLFDALIGDLNTALRTTSFYREDRFAGVALRARTTEMLRRNPAGDNLVRLNRLLLEDAYPASLKPTLGMSPALCSWGTFLGNRNIALFLGALLSLLLLVRRKGHLTLAKIAEMIEPPLATAGIIILITSAGGAFGLMLKNAGVGEAVKAAVAGKEINLLVLSWLVAAVIRVAQGSATVAMLTTAAMVYPIMTTGPALPYHPIYIFMAIGFGAMTLSWMNDSGFWVVCKLTGFTEKETLKSWTAVVTINSLAGLVTCLVLSKILPQMPGG
jgi:H+/gluconate symporter-like permease